MLAYRNARDTLASVISRPMWLVPRVVVVAVVEGVEIGSAASYCAGSEAGSAGGRELGAEWERRTLCRIGTVIGGLGRG